MASTEIPPYSPDYAVPPGAILEEWLQERGMTQTELAERMGRPIKTVNEIIKGKCAVTQETALQLERVTGIRAGFWTNADMIFQERGARLREGERIRSWVPWSRQFPYGEMAKRGWVPAEREPASRVRALLRFFGVAEPEAWKRVYAECRGSLRKSPAFECDPAHLAAWLRQGEIEASTMECAPYDRTRFNAALREIRSLTAGSADTAYAEAASRCCEAGVAFVLVPELSKTHVSGVTRWLSPSKALIQNSLRYKTDDHLWFTFFHEAVHVLNHPKKGIIMEFKGKDDHQEDEANRWARDFLIPPREWSVFVNARSVSEPRVKAFAARLGIGPSIVVGRLQHERIIPHAAMHRLKQTLRLESTAASRGVAAEGSQA